MKAVFLLAAAGVAFGQIPVLSPVSEFDLNAGVKSHHFGKHARSFFAATPNGLTLVTINDNRVILTLADLDGRIVHSRSDLRSVNSQIFGALPRPDGNVWLVWHGPYSLSESFSSAPDIGSALPDRPSTGRGSTTRTNYNELDLYSPTGEILSSARRLSPVLESESLIAATNAQLVLRSSGVRSPQSQLLHFGTVEDGSFKERTQVRLTPPVSGAIPLLASNGDLLLIDKASGNLMIIDPKTKGSSVVRAVKPQPVLTAATDSESIYLLSTDLVVKEDLSGQVLSTYRVQVRAGFQPASLGVTGDSLYLVDETGHTERFHFN